MLLSFQVRPVVCQSSGPRSFFKVAITYHLSPVTYHLKPAATNITTTGGKEYGASKQPQSAEESLPASTTLAQVQGQLSEDLSDVVPRGQCSEGTFPRASDTGQAAAQPAQTGHGEVWPRALVGRGPRAGRCLEIRGSMPECTGDRAIQPVACPDCACPDVPRASHYSC